MVVSKGFAVVAIVVVVGTLVVVVKAVGLDVTVVVSLLVMVEGTDVVVSRITVVGDVVSLFVTTFCAVLDAV